MVNRTKSNFSRLKRLLGCFFFLSAVAAQAQDMDELIGRGKAYMDEGRYEQANLTFRRVLTLNKPIPKEFCYFFAETLSQINQFQNSKNFLSKYFELADESGKYYQQAVALNKRVEQELAAIQACGLCDQHGYVLTSCDRCGGAGDIQEDCHHCKGKGKIICDVCMGDGVVVRKNVFNANEYASCQKCGGSGALVCPVCRGEKTLTNVCRTCDGSGQSSSSEICSHKPSENQIK